MAESLTQADLDGARQERLNEKGTEPDCPFCGRARVRRSDYTRCNPCGVNWLEGEDLTADPRNQRYRSLVDHMRSTARPPTASSGGARTVGSTTKGD